MTRQRKQPEGRRRQTRKSKKPGLLSRAVTAAGNAIVRHPSVAGGGAAFFVVFSFVAANAIWYQPGGHPAPIMSTRTEFRPPRPAALAPPAPRVAEVASSARSGRSEIAPQRTAEPEKQSIEDILRTVPTHVVTSTSYRREESDPPTASIPGTTGENGALEAGYDSERQLRAAVQRELQRLGFYDGQIDGLDGPKTRAALKAFGARAGLKRQPVADAETLALLRIANLDAVAKPVSRPAGAVGAEGAVARIQKVSAGADFTRPPAAIPQADRTTRVGYGSAQEQSTLVMQIQQGLSNIAYADVAVDGIAGSETRKAIRSFEKHYRMPQTGEPSQALLDKLKEIGAL